MKKNIFAKATLDTLDFIEYFCANGNPELVWEFVGYEEAKKALRTQTLNEEYANNIAFRLKLSPVEHNPSTVDLLNFLRATHRLNFEAITYLKERAFPLDMLERYHIGSYRPADFVGYDFGSVSKFYLFDPNRLEYLNYVMQQLKLDINLLDTTFLVMPSFDNEGQLNNLAFRVLDPTIESKAFKWLFSHGRQATFGLNRVLDPRKPITVIEGYFDYVACKECGMSQPVALGSAFFSPFHLRYLKQLGSPIDVLFDSDTTGKKYTQMLEPLADQLNRVLVLDPLHKDPWDWWTKEGEVRYKEA